MKQSTILLAIVLFLTTPSFSQETDKFLSLSCDCLDKLLKSKMEKVEFQFSHDECFKEVYSRIISFSSQEQSDAFYEDFMERLKSDCESYNQCHDILDKMTLEKSEIIVKNKLLCKQIMKTGEFEDKRGTEKVVMSMQDSIQIVTFGEKGLYTKSRIEWIDECSYKVTFSESNNPFENAVLKKGDEREIRIIDIRTNGEIVFETGIYNRWFLSKLKKIK